MLLGSAFSPGSDGFISGQPAASSAGFSEVFISGPTDDDLLTQFLQRGQSGDGTTVPAAYTVLTGYSLSGNIYQAADFIVIGQVKWAAAGSLAVTPETWHSLGASGATGFTDVKNSYRRNVFNEVEFDIQLTAGGGGGTAGIYTYANTLPAAYRPTVNRAYPLGVQGTWLAAGARFPILKVFTTGQVDIHLPAASASGNTGGLPVMPLD